MNWVGILWPMISGSCLTLAFIYCLAWWRAPARISHLMLAVAAASVAAVGLLEVAAMTATEPAAYARMIRWAHVPVAVSAACVIGFVFHHYGVGSPVLAILAIATRFACLVPNFLSGVNLNYASIDSLRQVAFLGTQVSIPDVATPNPWMLLGTGNALLIAAFLVQAIVQLAGRRPSPERTRAIVTCTTILVFVLASGVWTWLLVNDRIDAPHLFAPMFLGVLLAMAYTLAGGFSSAGRLAHSLEFALGRRRQARRRMLQAVDAAGVGYWTIDTGSGRVRLSHRASALLDVPPRQAMTREELLERLPEADREALVAATGAVGEGEFHSEFRVRLEEGGHRWLGVHGRAVTDGGRRSLDGVVVDITSRKESESRFRLVVEAASAAHLVVAPSGKVAFANRAAAEIFGDTAGGLEGMDFHALVRAEGEAVAAGDAPLDAWPGSTAIGETVELAGIRDGGATTIALAATFNPVPLDSELYLLVSLVDLSEQRRVERETALQRDEIAHLSRVSLLEMRPAGQGLTWLADWLNDRYGKASCVVIDGRNGVDVLVERIKDTWRAKNSVIRPSAKDVIAAVSGFTNGISEGTLTWYKPQTVLNESAITAVKRPIAGGFGFGGDNSLPVEACALALWGAKTSRRDPTRKMKIG